MPKLNCSTTHDDIEGSECKEGNNGSCSATPPGHCKPKDDAEQLADKDPARLHRHEEKHADSHTGKDADQSTVKDDVLDHP